MQTSKSIGIESLNRVAEQTFAEIIATYFRAYAKLSTIEHFLAAGWFVGYRNRMSLTRPEHLNNKTSKM